MTTDQQTMATSDFNLEKLTTPELEQHINASILTESNIAVFSLRGSGKTSISKQEIKNIGYREVYLNLSVLERVDLGGYPNVMSNDPKRKFVDFLLPQFYEPMLHGDQPVVCLLDEVDKADPSLWAPLLELVQEKSINGRKLTNLKSCIMTGNLISEGGSRPSLPLLDRTEKYLLEANARDWLNWAGRVGTIHPSVTSYIFDHPSDLFGGANQDDRYADPSPRGWTGGSDIIFKGEKLGLNPHLINKKVSGRVGKDAGIKYRLYFEHYQQLLPLIDGVFAGKDVSSEFNSLEPTKQLIGAMITCSRLANQLDAATPETAPMTSIKNVGKFLDKAPDEHVLISVRSQIQVERIIKYALDEMPHWDSMMEKILQKAEE